MEYNIVGKRIPRVDAREKAVGAAVYIDDMVLPGMLFGKIVRSTLAHARIRNIDVSRAAKAPGVKAVVTANDMTDRGGLVGPFIKDEPIFAQDKVRYVGEPIAAVAAIDLAAAEAAAALVTVEYEELTPVFDPIEAMKPDAPTIHENLKNYFKVFEAIQEGNVCSHTTFIEGDVEKGFREADVIVEDTFTTSMIYQAYIEPNGAIAQWDASGRLTVWSNTQGVFVIQDRICESLKIPMSKIRVQAPRLGGGFGGKIETSVQPAAAVLAKKAGKPVKIIVSREEDFPQARPRHPAVGSYKLGVKKNGLIAASQMSCVFDSGAYADDGPGVAGVGAIFARGPYRVPNFRMEGYCVYTNKVKTGAMRGFGNPQTTFLRESVMDMAAREIGMDPVDFRMKNVIVPGDKSVGGQTINSVGVKECLSRVAETINWKSEKKGKYRGRGLACINHPSGLLTVASVVRINEDGTATIQCGAMEIGQGSDTVICQIVAEELGLPMEDVALVSADTDATPYTWATTANRITYTAGNSVRLAAKDARAQLLDLAATMLNEEDLQIKDKKIFSRRNPAKVLSYHDLGKISAWAKGGAIIGKSSFMVEEPKFDTSGFIGYPFGTPFAAYIFGVQGVEVEVDVETGQVQILNAVAAHDMGQPINPIGVEGQIQGGFVQAMGMALTEAVAFDKTGRIINTNFTDYKIPAAADVPPLTPIMVEAYDETGPFGAKGVGEGVIMGVAPALANAIYDAVGIRLTDLPMTPERLLKALEEKQKK